MIIFQIYKASSQKKWKILDFLQIEKEIFLKPLHTSRMYDKLFIEIKNSKLKLNKSVVKCIRADPQVEDKNKVQFRCTMGKLVHTLILKHG